MKIKLDNARESEQIKRMKQLAKQKKCHFCKEGFEETHSSPIIYENKNWFITANDFPYKGTKHHYLIVSKKHIKQIEEIDSVSIKDWLLSIKWLKNKLKIKGYSVFVRSGDMSLTGATLDHLHFHFIVGVRKTKNMSENNRLLVTLGYKK